ncbi:SDR family NAD(P)-dependent oxidoreductase [Microbacterium luticocti]|uniref:SDR family NAD(P)-dependent oxidoreductase n=1 Tax=Microbacterium luticocti TaxID=451764 RepID=UPI0004011EE8|nr:SDR family oxidoreductase [Microbacterium luticocti]
MTDLSSRTVLVAGATSESGRAAVQALRDAGARAIAVGHDPVKLEALAERIGGDGPQWLTESCDLTDEQAVFGLAERLHGDGIHIDGVLHLVGGWRGGGGLAGQTDEDYRFLERSLTALRHVTRAFDDDLNASDAARLAIVSSTAVARPLAGGANYATVKAAAEAWTRAVAQGFAKTARDAGRPLCAASVVFRVKALDGLEQTLADRFVALWDADAAEVNDSVIDLTSGR